MAYFDTMKVPRALIWCIRSKRRMSVSATVVSDTALRIVDDNVEAAEFCRCRFDSVLDRVLVAHVDRER